MNVVFLLNFLPAYRIPVYERLSAEEGINVTVVYAPITKEIGKLAVNDSAELGFKTKIIGYKETRLEPFILRWLPGGIRSLCKLDPDVLVMTDVMGNVSYWIALIWARLRRVKVYLWVCGHETQREGSKALFFKKMVGRVYYGLANRLMVYSSTAKKTMVDKYGIPESRITICYNGLEIGGLLDQQDQINEDAKQLRAAENVRDEEKVFLFVGGLIAVKRIGLLIEAFAKADHSNAVLWIVGDGPEKNSLVALAEQTHARIRFFGRVVDGVDKYFAACDFFVLPRLGGLALNQAMFWEKICLCSVADGTEDDLVIDGQTGIRFEKDDLDSLHQALLRALALDSDQQGKMGDAARKLILECSNVEQMVKTFSVTIRRDMGEDD